MGISLDELYAGFEAYRGYSLNDQQKAAVESDTDATWILAGPGTGKTETVVVRVLRLLLVDEVPPESILFTTFTTRAATNLEDRLALYLDGILETTHLPDVERPNVSAVWIGTLHHLAHDLLRQLDADTSEMTLLDGEASLFKLLRELTTGTIQNEQLYRAITGREVPPYRRYDRIHYAEQLKTAIDRTVEDNVDMAALERGETKRPGPDRWPEDRARSEFLGALTEYEAGLDRAVDFSRLQRRFLEFLRSDEAETLLDGDADQQFPGIDHVIVDEYQDTNPIQEQIYHTLGRHADSFVVVGDDDQALYRFRGASVDAMVTFDERVEQMADSTLETIELYRNYRSRDGLVSQLNSYVDAAANVGRFRDARTDKPPLEAAAPISGTVPPVQLLVGDTEADLARATVDAISSLQTRGVIDDLRQAALLSHSTKVTSRSPFGHYHKAFGDADIPIFNPGAKNLHEDEYLKSMLGILSLVLDPNDDVLRVEGQDIREYVGFGDEATATSLRTVAAETLSDHPDLRSWVEETSARFDQSGWHDDTDYPRNWNFLDVFYGIANHAPFSKFVDDTGGPQQAVEAWRFGWLSRVIESFQQNLGLNGRLFPAEDDSYTAQFYQIREAEVPEPIRGVNPFIVDAFYRDLLGVFKSGGFDEIEDEVESLPPRHVPALTIHQAKGLEFPLVFLTATRPFRGASTEQHQEDLFYPYRESSARDIERFSQEKRAMHDAIRRFFVGLSRAQSLCVITLQREVYDGLLARDDEITTQYPQLPPNWLEGLPTRYIS